MEDVAREAGSEVFPFDIDLTPRRFARRADGFAHALAGGLWAPAPMYLSSPRWGTQLYAKVVSTDREKLLRWAGLHGIPARALQRKDLPDLEARRRGIRKRVEAYHIDLWGDRLGLAGATAPGDPSAGG